MSMEDAPTNAPMAPRDSTRTSPSTDQLKVRRRLSMVDDSPGQRFVANLWTEMQNDVKETTDVDTSQQREAALLAEAQTATLERRRQLLAEVNRIREERTATLREERSVDLYAETELSVPHIATGNLAGGDTDWMLDEDDEDEPGVARTMAAAASVWYRQVPDFVRADREEFAMQAQGAARHYASAHISHLDSAMDTFLRRVAFMNRTAADDLPDEVETICNKTKMGPTGNTLYCTLPKGHDEGHDFSKERKTSSIPLGTRLSWNPFLAADLKEQDEDTPPLDWSAEAPNTNHVNEVDHEVEATDPADVPYDVPFDNFGAPVHPLNAPAVAEEGERVPMPGLGEAVSKLGSNATAEQILAALTQKRTANEITDPQHVFTLNPDDPDWIGNFTDDAIDENIRYWSSDEGKNTQPNLPGYDTATLKMFQDEKARRQGSKRTAGITYDGIEYGTGITDGPSRCIRCGNQFDQPIEAWVNGASNPNILCRWCGLDIERGATASKTAADGNTCSVCGDSITRDPEGEDNRTWHHTNGTSHDHEAKPSGGDKESARTAAKVAGDVPPEFLEQQKKKGDGDEDDEDADKKPWEKDSARTAGVYCKDHDVWVGDGNADTHGGCSKEQRATDKTKDASRNTASSAKTATDGDENTEEGKVEGEVETREPDNSTMFPWNLPAEGADTPQGAADTAGETPPYEKSSGRTAADDYALECYSCGKKGTNDDFGYGNNRKCPSCGSSEVHSPDAHDNWKSSATVGDRQALAAFRARVAANTRGRHPFGRTAADGSIDNVSGLSGPLKSIFGNEDWYDEWGATMSCLWALAEAMAAKGGRAPVDHDFGAGGTPTEDEIMDDPEGEHTLAADVLSALNSGEVSMADLDAATRALDAHADQLKAAGKDY
jgi:hypothetical protein